MARRPGHCRDIIAGVLAATKERTDIVDIGRRMEGKVCLLAGDPRWEKVNALALELGNWYEE